MIRAWERARRGRRGITLTECLIGIMILGIGLVSIATLFPIGLLRLREATRQSRSATLFESAAADMAARNLVAADTFKFADYLNKNPNYNLTWWYPNGPNGSTLETPMTPYGSFNPLIQDAASYGGFVYTDVNPTTDLVGLDASNATFNSRGAAGLPFAYDPLWRYQVVPPGKSPRVRGIYPHDPLGSGEVPEARFGSGLGFVRNDPSGGLPSAHGLQRLSNFNGRIYGTYTDSTGATQPSYVMPSTRSVPAIFVSPEDIVWNDPTNPSWSAVDRLYQPNRSPILPDHTVGQTQAEIDYMVNNTTTLPTDQDLIRDWRYSWLFTGSLTGSTNGAQFQGDIVIYENRPFELEPTTSPIDGSTQLYKPADETVVEAVFGHGRSVVPSLNVPAVGYAAAADRTVLLRWPAAMADPIVKVGNWICDVTYERQQVNVFDPFAGTGRFISYFNPLNGGKADNMPAQRAFWYQVVKVGPAIADPQLGGNYRSMVVQVGSRLRARTPLLTDGTGLPATVNAALIAPNVVNVLPQTIVVH